MGRGRWTDDVGGLPVRRAVQRIRERGRVGVPGEVARDHAAQVDAIAVDDRARGDRRALRAESDHVLAREDGADGATGRVGELARGRGDHRRLLPAERAAVRERRRRRAARCAPGGIGLEVRGLDPSGGEAHTAGRQRRERQRGPGRHRGPPALDLARELPCLDQRLRDHPADPRRFGRRRARARRQRDRDQCVAGRGVVGEPAPPERDRGTHRLVHPALELRTSRRRVGVPPPRRRGTLAIEVRRGGDIERLVDRLPPGAAAEVGGEGAIGVDA